MVMGGRTFHYLGTKLVTDGHSHTKILIVNLRYFHLLNQVTLYHGQLHQGKGKHLYNKTFPVVKLVMIKSL